MKEKMSYAKIDSCTMELINITKDIENTLEQVKNISDIINQKSLWQGKAADFYAECLTRFVRSTESVDLELRKCSIALEQFKEKYQQLDKKIISAVNNGFHIE